ncbi:hypothetical protein ACJMK2_030865 [Sinanodonta woodiana]|uniref:Allorecognition 1 n=1 Tax=Sinanodonta woodiana TaxID=1069815 RepID=A0ABD3WX29_SINWO
MEISNIAFCLSAIETALSTATRVFVRATTTTVNASIACNRESPTDTSDFSVLVKEGAVSSLQAIATCPNDFLATFSNFTVTGYSGANQCTGNSLAVCTDRTAMNYTYNSCSSSVKFSSGGYFYCLYYQTNSSTGVTYLHVYNKDSTVVSGSTYRIVCYAFKTSGNILYTTEYPGSCHSNQNATYVKSPGLIANYFNTTNTCVIVVKSNIQDWKYIAAIVGGLAGLAVLIIVLVVVIKKQLLCRACHKERKVTQSQDNVEEPIQKTVPIKFVAKKPKKIKNVIVIAEATKHILETPVMPELLYTVEPKRMTSPRKMFYQTPTFKSEKSLGKIELEPHNQKEKS